MTALAWLAPWFFGMGVWVLALGWPRRAHAWSALVGGGWLLGALATGMLPALFAALIAPQDLVRIAGPFMLLVGVALLVFGWRRVRMQPVAVKRVADMPLARGWQVLIALLVALLALRFGYLWREATLPPLFPWDAWTSWAVKPATWFELDRWARFVPYEDWLASGDPMLYTSEAEGYPRWLGRLEAWYAAGMGCWCDPAFTRLWPAAWLAMLLAVYGLLRDLRVRVLAAALAVYALGSLPLVDAHAALAGYADLWIGAFLVLGVLLWLGWYRERAPERGVLALCLILALPAIKLEGGIWMLLALGVMALALIAPRWRLRVVFGALALVGVLALGLIAWGWRLPVPGFGTVHIEGALLHVPGLRPMWIGWRPATGAVLKSLFVASSWHLLFYVALGWIAWRWRAARDGAGFIGLIVLGALAFLFVLFFFTVAAIWAENFTSIGRLLLQIVPLLVAFMALLDRPHPLDEPI